MHNLKWLTKRPIAHRGLHDASAGIIENTASAFAAALPHGYGIECDLQVSADGEAMVFHDDTLERLTEGRGAVRALRAAALKTVRFKGSADPMLTLGDLCDLVAGRVPLVIEMKSRFDGDLRVAARAAAVLARYQGPAALMSFDPSLVALLRATAPGIVRGIVAERRYAHPEWAALNPSQKFQLAHLLHAPKTRPQFIAYAVKDLPSPVPWVARNVLGLPLLSWTVRSQADRQRAAAYADQIIFEGFQP